MDNAAATVDENDITSSITCMAITAEKRRPQGQHPATGCTGIFHQLFDWNRRLAKNNKKNLNLLSSGTPKNSTSKRFGAHDPPASKFHLVAEENSGGFPNAKKHRMYIVPHKNDMRPPSLVAKLMGLDSIPIVKNKQVTPKLASQTNQGKVDEEGIVAEEGVLSCINEPRPQKQQKMGQDELQLRNVLSRSSKQLRSQKGSQHPKLPTPVKSHRVRSGKNATRLFNAATKILEPRLRVSSRANAITYPEYMRHELNDELSVREGTLARPPALSTRSAYYSSPLDNSRMPSPCKNCGLRDIDSALQPCVTEKFSKFQSDVTRYSSLSPQKWSSRPTTKEDNDRLYELDGNQPVFVVSQSHEDCLHTCNELVKEKGSFTSHDQKEWHFLSPPHSTERPVSPHCSEAFIPHQRKTIRMSFDRDSIPLRPKLGSLPNQRVTSAVNSITEIKDISRSSRGVSRQKLLNKVDNVRFHQESEQSLSKLHPKTQERKRRITNSFEKVGNGPSSSRKPGAYKFHELRECSSNSQSDSMANRKFSIPVTRNKSEEPCSFTFQSPAKCNSEIPLSKDKIGSAARQMDISRNKTMLTLPPQPVSVSSGVLDILLKQKLKELSFMEQREQGASRVHSKTSRILQELISALEAEQHSVNNPMDTDKLYHHSVHSSENISHQHDMSPDTITAEKAKKIAVDTSTRYFCDSDRLSPGSVLGASFSSSCISSSLDDYADIILQHGMMEHAHYISQPSELSTQLKHVTSTDTRSTLDQFIKCISIMLEELMKRGATFPANKLSHIKEVMLHAGLILENGALIKPAGVREFFVCHFFKQLETFANAMWPSSKDPPGYNVGKDETQLKGILLDIAVEYLGSRFGNNSNLKFDPRRRLSLKLTAQQMILDLNKMITQWVDLAGMTPDELIEWDVIHSRGYLEDYEIEVGCVCSALDEEVLKTLVEEMVMDLYQINRCRNQQDSRFHVHL